MSEPEYPEKPGFPVSDGLISWAEKTFKTDIRYLVYGLSWSTIAQIVAALTAFVLSLFISRLVPKDVYGNYKYILAVITILSTLSLNNIGGAIMQSVARGYDGSFLEGVKENLKWSIAIFCGALAVGAYYLLLGNYVLGLGILIGGSITPFLASANLYASFLLGKKNFALQAWYGDVVTNIIPAIALIVVAYVAPRPLPLVFTYFSANLTACAYAYFRTLRRYKPDPAKHDPEMLTYAKHLSAIGIMNGIAGNMDQVLLFHFTSAAELAIYSFAIGILDQLKGPLKTLDAMMQARFAAQDSKSIYAGMRNKYLWLLVACLIIVVIYIILAPWFYRIFFPNYIASVPYSQVYAISVLSFALTPVTSFLAAKKLVRAQYISTAITSVIQLTTIFIGTILWGLWGLIIARVLTRFASGIISLFVYSTESQV